MHSLRRWLLIGLLILALPLKGLAAAGVLGCAAWHGPAAPGVAHGQGAGHGAELHAAHSNPANPDPANLDSGNPGNDSPAPQGVTIKCTQCAPCCGAVAPPLEPSGPLVMAGTPDLSPAPDLPALGGGGQRLERPPRDRRD